MRKLYAQPFLRSPRSTDPLAPAVVWERDDQKSGPSGRRATRVPDGRGQAKQGGLATRPDKRRPDPGQCLEASLIIIRGAD